MELLDFYKTYYKNKGEEVPEKDIAFLNMIETARASGKCLIYNKTLRHQPNYLYTLANCLLAIKKEGSALLIAKDHDKVVADIKQHFNIEVELEDVYINSELQVGSKYLKLVSDGK